jgi:hypothetical protein
MHYNELQSGSAEVEAMASNFQKMVADERSRKGWIKGQTGPEKGGWHQRHDWPW